jgi:dTDP-4-amino-4,6-dideoxygalactose transaminase
VDSLRSGWITTGPKVSEFEKQICGYTGASYAAATFSCTSAMHLALTVLGIKAGDEVIVPTFTFTSTAQVVVQCGAKPVFVDITEDSFSIDINEVRKKITSRTKAIIPVHYGGNPVDMDQIFLLAKKHNIKIVEDAAHAIGSSYNGKKIGNLESDATCFSFYATKNLSTAEGGMVVTNSKSLADNVKKLAIYGISDSREIWNSRYNKHGSWFYDVEMVGFKANMTDISAAMGLHQLLHLDESNNTRHDYAKFYKNTIMHKGIEFMKVDENDTCAWHLFPMLLPKNIDRDRFIEAMNKNNIGTSVLFRPLHLHTAYRKLLGTKAGDFPNSENIFNRLVNLPISPSISKTDVKYIAQTVNKNLTIND